MSDTCSHRSTQKATPEHVASDVAQAEALCLERGERWTTPRGRVYELLLRAGGPLKAYDLMDGYAEGRSAKPPTVYRALEFLEAQGLVHRIASLNAYTACGAHPHAHSTGFLICECCGGAQEFELELAPTIAAAAAAHGFDVSKTMLELRGSCSRCSA